MIILNPSTDSLEIVTSAPADVDYIVSYADHTTSGVVAAEAAGNVNTATTTTAVSAPGAGVIRQIRGLRIINKSASVSTTITVQLDVSGTDTTIFKCVLMGGEILDFTDSNGWRTMSDHGRTRVSTVPPYPEGYEIPILKVGLAPEGAGIMTTSYTSTLFPPAWVVGTPGTGGRAVVSEVGRLQVNVPSAGYAYLEGLVFSANVISSQGLIDILWVNSGLSPTTTAAQNVNSVAFPTRDLEQTADGRGVEIGILVTTSTGNASTVTTIQMGYTNSTGAGSRTATISSFPPTCAAGSIIPFQLAAGDNGVRSIQTITLGTSLGAGAVISLIAFRRVMTVGCVNTNQATDVRWSDDGVRILSGSTIIPIQIPTSTAITTIQGTAYIHDMD